MAAAANASVTKELLLTIIVLDHILGQDAFR
jgi:hypothetical protein